MEYGIPISNICHATLKLRRRLTISNKYGLLSNAKKDAYKQFHKIILELIKNTFKLPHKGST